MAANQALCTRRDHTRTNDNQSTPQFGRKGSSAGVNFATALESKRSTTSGSVEDKQCGQGSLHDKIVMEGGNVRSTLKLTVLSEAVRGSYVLEPLRLRCAVACKNPAPRAPP